MFANKVECYDKDTDSSDTGIRESKDHLFLQGNW